MSIFTKNAQTKVKSNKFDLSHDRKMSTKMGNLIPINLMDVIPGDDVRLKTSVMVRFAPLIAPIMHSVKCYIHYFFVPNRLIWNDWEDFITGGENGIENPTWPYLNLKLKDEPLGSLSDHLGLPVDSDADTGNTNIPISAIPYAVYQLIFHEYYRDQNLQPGTFEKLREGTQSTSQIGFLKTIRKRSWGKDYFTSALPWTQKGPEAMMPLGTEAPLKHKPDQNTAFYRVIDGNPLAAGENVVVGNTSPTSLVAENDPENTFADIEASHYADLSAATASSITDLRRAFKLQEWLEKNARGGSRYNESIYVHFGVASKDQRLARPEYLGGVQTPVKVSEVLQTSNNDTQETPQGNMAGHAISVGSGKPIQYRATEHGYIMGLMSIMPDSAYQQGIPRHFSRMDKFDYYWPEFAHIGEQAILNQELYATDNAEHNTDVFGYTPRYAEYKFMNSSVHGDFRKTLDFWHLGRKFNNPPALNEDFITMKWQEANKIFAVQDGTDNMWCHIYNEVKADRKMPYFGNPKL